MGHMNKTTTLRQALIAATVKAAAVTLMAGAALSLATDDTVTAEQTTQAPEAQQTPAEALIERHGCWTGEAPADMVGVIPGHVVTQHGYQGEKAVGHALAQMFDGADHGLTVYAFCR